MPGMFLVKTQTSVAGFTDNFNRSDRSLSGDNGWVATGTALNIVGNRAATTLNGQLQSVKRPIAAVVSSTATPIDVSIDVINTAGSGFEVASIYIGDQSLATPCYIVNFFGNGQVERNYYNGSGNALIVASGKTGTHTYRIVIPAGASPAALLYCDGALLDTYTIPVAVERTATLRVSNTSMALDNFVSVY